MTYPEHPPIRPTTPPQPAAPPPIPQGQMPPGYGPAPVPYPYAPPTLFGPPVPAPRNGLGTAAMVLGIIGVLSTLGSQSSERSFENSASMVGYFLVPVTLGVLAVVFGATGQARVRRREATNSGRATSGLVLGIVTLALCAVLMAVTISRL